MKDFNLTEHIMIRTMSDKLEQKQRRMNRSLEFMHKAARELELAGEHVDALRIDTVIAVHEQKLEVFTEKHFPITERKQNR